MQCKRILQKAKAHEGRPCLQSWAKSATSEAISKYKLSDGWLPEVPCVSTEVACVRIRNQAAEMHAIERVENIHVQLQGPVFSEVD